MKHIMQHDEGKIFISKPIMINSTPNDDIIKSISKTPDSNPISAPMDTNSTIMESIITHAILASLSSKKKIYYV